MGMDIFGRRATNKVGEYYRSNVWTWRVIHQLCNNAIHLQGLPFNTFKWAFNDGKGLHAQEHCDLLADSLETYIKKNPPANRTYFIDFGAYVDKEPGSFVDGLGPNSEPAHSASIKDIKQFIKFLKSCGGFEVH